MKNNFKKIIFIGISLVCLTGMPIYASDELPILTLEESIKSGFVYSDQLSLNAEEKDLLKDRLKLHENNIYEVYQSIYLQKAKNENQKEILQDQITYDVTSRYYNIVILEKELINLEHTILLKIKELEQMKYRKQEGVITPIQYESIELELETLEDSKQSALDDLENDKSYFKLITGKDLTKYTLEDTPNFEPFRILGDVERYIESTVDKYLKYDKDLAQFAKDHIIIAGTPTVFYADYLDKKYTADKSLITLEDAKKEMKDALMESYSTLINLEEQMNTLETKYKLVQKQVTIAKAQYETGMITALDYNKQSLNLENIELNLRKLITHYNILKQVIEKPWMAITSN